MIPADVDPTLCAAEPSLETLDDGFSPPAVDEQPVGEDAASTTHGHAPGAKSPF